jgi:hypothetical protein
MFDWFAMICVRLNVNVFAYEYTGYGAASGRRPLEGQVKMDADAAWRFLTEQHGTPPDRVVLYGQSIGSGATCWLGQRYEPAGLVLHASIMSGLRVMIPVKRSSPPRHEITQPILPSPAGQSRSEGWLAVGQDHPD